MKTEKHEQIIETKFGKLRMVETIAVFRESVSGKREVMRKERLTLTFVPDGPWLTDAMITELDTWVYTNFATNEPTWFVLPNAATQG